jgi:hypothetical protein
MAFHELGFLFIFFPVAMLLYFLVPKVAKTPVMVALSLVFFAWGSMEFVILLGFGKPQGTPLRIGSADFKRKTPAQIADREDTALEPARVAPSSTNSQPWFFTHEEDAYHAYMATDGLRRHTMIGSMNRIDMGIALAHMYVANEARFRYFCADAPKKDGYKYIGSFTL